VFASHDIIFIVASYLHLPVRHAYTGAGADPGVDKGRGTTCRLSVARWLEKIEL